MHIATVKNQMVWGKMTLEPGRYWLEDHNAAEVLWAGRGMGDVVVEARPKVDSLGLRWCWQKEGAVIHVVRVGGFGDLLWLNAIYQEMKRINPSLTIKHACFDRYRPVMEGFVDGYLDYPLREKDAMVYGFYWLENLIEGKPCLDGEHPCDRLAEVFGLDPLPRKSAYVVTDAEREAAQSTWPRVPGKKRVCVQTSSSTGNKNYPHLGELMARMATIAGWELLLVGDPLRPGESVVKVDAKGVAQVKDARKMGQGIRHSIALAAECDAIVGADSVFIHVGAALDIPVVGLFGPFHGESYMAGQRGQAIQGGLPCSPCSWHPRGSEFPPGMPCAAVGQCVSLGDRTADYVFGQLVKVL